MIIATWNLNNRVGKVRFRPEAAQAAIAIGADLLVLTEFYPQQYEQSFRAALAQAGWPHQTISPESTEVANRVLMVSRAPLLPLPLARPDFDRQFPANVLGVTLTSTGLAVLGVRVPAYKGTTAPLLFRAWQWLETTAASLKRVPAIIIGDLNVATTSSVRRAGDVFRRILDGGWQRAAPSSGATFFGSNGCKTEIDHILATKHCTISSPAVLQQAPGFSFAGEPNAISDHAVLLCNVDVLSSGLREAKTLIG